MTRLFIRTKSIIASVMDVSLGNFSISVSASRDAIAVRNKSLTGVVGEFNDFFTFEQREKRSISVLASQKIWSAKTATDQGFEGYISLRNTPVTLSTTRDRTSWHEQSVTLKQGLKR